MGNLLGKKGGGKGAVKAGKAAPKVSEADRAVLQLKMQRDKMLQGRKKVLSVMARETEIAKALLKEGKKDRAKLALKKRKMQEKMLENHDAQMERMEEMIEGVEQAQREKKLFEVMQMGNQALKDMQKELSLEDVENLMEETQEAVAYQKQIEELLSEQLAPIDLEEMERELEALGAEQGLVSSAPPAAAAAAAAAATSPAKAATPTAAAAAAAAAEEEAEEEVMPPPPLPDLPEVPTEKPVLHQPAVAEEEEEEEEEEVMPPPQMVPA